MGRRHRGFLPGRGGKGGCAREQGGVKDIQREPTVVVSDAGCCQHTSCQHTPGARHTYTHMHTGLALSVRTTLPTVPPPPSPPIHPHPPPPTTPEDPIWNQSTATTLVPSLPCCGPARVYFTELETWDDCALDTKTDRTSQCLEVKMHVKAVSCLGIFAFF